MWITQEKKAGDCGKDMNLQEEMEQRRVKRLKYIKGILERDEERIKENLK